MAHSGKRIVKARETVDRIKLYKLDEAVKLVKERATAKFDETVELALNLGVDPKHADQMVRGVVNLPNGTGRVLRVAVFARGAKAGKITIEQIREIATKKLPDLNCDSVEAAMAMVKGSAQSMGLEIVG